VEYQPTYTKKLGKNMISRGASAAQAGSPSSAAVSLAEYEVNSDQIEEGLKSAAALPFDEEDIADGVKKAEEASYARMKREFLMDTPLAEQRKEHTVEWELQQEANMGGRKLESGGYGKESKRDRPGAVGSDISIVHERGGGESILPSSS